jgi:hypothetical protein
MPALVAAVRAHLPTDFRGSVEIRRNRRSVQVRVVRTVRPADLPALLQEVCQRDHLCAFDVAHALRVPVAVAQVIMAQGIKKPSTRIRARLAKLLGLRRKELCV